MRFLLVLPFLVWASLGVAQSSGLQAAVAQLPLCARECLGAAIEVSPCTATNTTCICLNAKLQSNVQTCLTSSCTLRESLTTKNATVTLCHAPVRDKSEGSRIANIALAVVTAICALTKVTYKAIYSMTELGWDDYTLLLTLLAGVPSVVLIDLVVLPNGLGRDIWTLQFEQITTFVHMMYFLEILYFFHITLLKLTLLLFFLRIFPRRSAKNLLMGTIAFTTLCGLTFVIVAIFQCWPISHYWRNWDKQHSDGKCININALAWSNAIISIMIDVWMLVLPLHEVFRLQLTWRKKIGVSVMFLVGTFVTVVSGLRLQSLVGFAASLNPTWDQVEVVNWSNIEVNVGIICTCLPTFRVILARVFPTIMGSTKAYGATNDSNYGYGSRVQGMSNRGFNMGQTSGRGINEITFVKTFEVQHADNDEMELIHMDKLGKESPKSSRSNTS